MQGSFPAVQVLTNSVMPPVKRNSAVFFRTFVGEGDLQAFVQEGQFAQALRQRIEAVDGFFQKYPDRDGR